MVAVATVSPRSIRKVSDEELLGASLSSLRHGETKNATERLQDSIKSLLSLDDEDDDDEEDNLGVPTEAGGHASSSSRGFATAPATLDKRNNASSMFSMLEHQEMNVQHVQLIQNTWEEFLGCTGAAANEDDDDAKTTSRRTLVGELIIDNMIALEPSSESSMGISSTYQTRKVTLSAIIVDSLNYIINKIMGPHLNEVELDCKAQEWLEEGIDAMLLHKALMKCLEKQHHDNKRVSNAALEACKTTFGDVLHKMAYAF